jgi:hypothetical protein
VTDSLARIERLNYLIGAVLCIGAAIGFATPVAVGVAAGVALTCLNFTVLRRLIFRWTQDAAQGNSGNRVLLVLPKMIVLMGLVLLALAFLPLDAIAFVVGFSIFLVSLTIESIYSALVPAPVSDGDQNGPDKTS